MKRYTLLLFIAYLFSICSFAQKGAQPSSTLLQNKWSASWIGSSTNSTAYGVYHFRKSFNLATQPQSFIINISADNRYRLFVNGNPVCIGPARGDVAHWRFETLDIAEHLRAGKNTLAVQVWNFGEVRPWAQISYQTGLVVQGNSSAEEIVDTNDTWKVIENVAYTPIASIAHITGPGDMVFAQRYPWGWEQNDYDDKMWPHAVHTEEAVPAGIQGNHKRRLIPRNIPFLEEKKQRIHVIRRMEGLPQDKNFLLGKGNLSVPPWAKLTILLDQEHLTTAYPELLISGGKGANITLTYAEALFDKNSGEKGNRNEIDNKEIQHERDHDVFLSDGGAMRLFRPLWYRTFRYVELTIENHQEGLTIHDFYSMFSAYPFQENAYFKSNEESLQNIWDVGWHTARLCAYETYMDCPYYEQLQYVGDTRIQALISLYVSGDDRLMKNAIEQFHHSIFEEGLTKSRYPDYLGQVIPPFSLFWIGMIHDYHMHRDDPAFIQSFLPAINKILLWHEKYIDGNKNMLGKVPYWNFVDWPEEWPWKGSDEVSGIPEGVLEGNSSILTLQYVDALKNAAALFAAYNMKNESQHCNATLTRLTTGTKNACWDTTKRLLADSPAKQQFSQHANLWAVLTDIVEPQDQKHFIHSVVNDTSLIQCTFYYRFYLNKAMKKAGFGDNYYAFLQPWRDMLALGLTTFAERPEPTRSDCHAWSASPNYDLLATVCGIEPSSPGFKTVKIQPHLGKLTWIEGEMPHPWGKIKVKFKKVDKGIEADITLPPGLTGELRWSGKVIGLKSGVKKIVLGK